MKNILENGFSARNLVLRSVFEFGKDMRVMCSKLRLKAESVCLLQLKLSYRNFLLVISQPLTTKYTIQGESSIYVYVHSRQYKTFFINP
jgi:hypothetical protein